MELFTINENNTKSYNWPAIYEDYGSSGMTINDYCKAKDICVSAFYHHKSRNLEKKLRANNNSNQMMAEDGQFVPVKVIGKPADDNVRFTIDGHEIACSREVLKTIMEVIL